MLEDKTSLIIIKLGKEREMSPSASDGIKQKEQAMAKVQDILRQMQVLTKEIEVRTTKLEQLKAQLGAVSKQIKK
jgi:hypothetical protein